MNQCAPLARRALAIPLLASVAVLAAACSSGGSGTPTATVTVTRTPGSGATAPAGTPPTTPGSTTPAGPAECATAGLHVTVGSSQGAAGTIYYNIDFTNSSSSSCVLQGYPGVSLVSAGSTAGSQIGADAKRNLASTSSPITVAPGQTAHAVLAIAQAGAFPVSKCHPVTANWLKVFPPDQTVAAYVSFSTQTCASTSVPTMRVTTVSAGA